MDAKTIIEHASREAAARAFYMAMSFWADYAGFSGLSRWARSEATGCAMHANDLLAYAGDYLGEKAPMPAVALETADYGSICEALKAALDLEIKVTTWLNTMTEAAHGESDYVTAQFLSSFLSSQIRSVSELRKLVAQAEACEDDPLADSALFIDYSVLAG